MTKELDEALERYAQRVPASERSADDAAREKAEAGRNDAALTKAKVVAQVHGALQGVEAKVRKAVACRFDRRVDGYAVYLLSRQGRDSLDDTLFVNVDETGKVRVTTAGKGGASFVSLGEAEAATVTDGWLSQRVAQWVDRLSL